MKRILITSTEVLMLHFLVPHVKNLRKSGYDVEIACSEVLGRFDELREVLGELVVIHKVDLKRSPARIKNLRGLSDLKQIIREGNYDMVWTNEPVMGVMTRLAARKLRKRGLKVLYMTHGFHFYKGSDRLNWVLFYPVEWTMAHLTDVLVTINQEDYALARKRMHAGRIKYIHGIGLDTEYFRNREVNVKEMRNTLGIPEQAVVLLSVGELQRRKNHEVMLRALAKMDYSNVYYIICGEGELSNYLHELAASLGIAEHVLFLGYRRDISELCKCADIFVHPSRREGLGIAALEGMASGLPIVASQINGILDYTTDGETGYNCMPTDADSFCGAINTLIADKALREKMGTCAGERTKAYDIGISKKEVLQIIEECVGR